MNQSAYRHTYIGVMGICLSLLGSSGMWASSQPANSYFVEGDPGKGRLEIILDDTGSAVYRINQGLHTDDAPTFAGVHLTASESTDYNVELKAPTIMGASYWLSLPTTHGTLGGFLMSHGDGTTEWYQSPIQSHEVYAYRKTTAQQITDNTATDIVFNEESYDADAAYDKTTGIYTAPNAGTYRVVAQVAVDAQARGDKSLALWKKPATGSWAAVADAVSTIHLPVTISSGGSYEVQPLTMTVLVDLAVGDQIKCCYTGTEITSSYGDSLDANGTFLNISEVSKTALYVETVSSTKAATSSNTPDTIVARDVYGDFAAGVITANTTKLNGSTSGTLSIVAAAATTDYSVTMPGAQGAVNTYLKNNGSGALTWSTVAGGLESVSGDEVNVHSTGGSTPVISLTTTAATAVSLANAATNANTASTIVKRDSSGNFSAGTITASGLSLNGSTSGTVNLQAAAITTATQALVLPAADGDANTYLKNNGSGALSWAAVSSNLAGDVTGSLSSSTVAYVGGVAAADIAAGANVANAATNANTASTIVKRDASGNFAAGTVTASAIETDSSHDTLSLGTTSNTSTINLGTGSGVQTVNVGTGSGVTTINLGGSSDIVNIAGTLTYVNTTDLNVTDKLITINKGGGTTSGSSAGVQVEENNSVTGYIKTSGDRNSWLLKSPNANGEVTITPGASGFTINQGVSTTDTPSFAGVTISGMTTAGIIHNNTSGVFSSSLIVNADVASNAAIADTKLATISSSGKVSNSATTATNANTASAIVARDASGNFSAGTITASGLSLGSSTGILSASSGAVSVTATPSVTSLTVGATSPVTLKVITAANSSTYSEISSTMSLYGAFTRFNSDTTGTHAALYAGVNLAQTATQIQSLNNNATGYTPLAISSGSAIINLDSAKVASIAAGNAIITLDDSTSAAVVKRNGSSTSFDASSDRRLKNISGDFDNGLEELRKLPQPKKFTWINTEYHDAYDHVGFIAQELQAYEPHWVKEGECRDEKDLSLLGPDKKTLLYAFDSKYNAILQQSLRELDLIVQTLIAQNNEQEQKIQELQTAVALLQA